MNIVPISAFTDNYIWCLHLDNQLAVVVDPGDAQAVSDYLVANQLELAGILITHHHFDHTGGVAELTQSKSVPVIGPKHSPFTNVTQTVQNLDQVTLHDLALSIIGVPGHTLDHIAFYLPEQEAVFCGDTLFSGGCGRVFEGTFEQMRASLESLRNLPESTRVFCAHEYTAANLRFALTVDPDNSHLQQRAHEVATLRSQEKCTLPTTLATERLSNPFLRWDAPAIIDSAQGRESVHDADGVFRVMRQWKDSF